MGTRQSESLGQFSARDNTCKTNNFFYRCIGDFHSAFFRHSISNVVCLCPNKEACVNVATWGIVAMMQRFESWQQQAIGQLISYAMGKKCFAINTKRAISMFVGTAKPGPTSIKPTGLIYSAPKTFGQRTFMCSQVCARAFMRTKNIGIIAHLTWPTQGYRSTESTWNGNFGRCLWMSLMWHCRILPQNGKKPERGTRSLCREQRLQTA